MERTRVLIVDDDLVHQMRLKRILSSFHIGPRFASTGEEALEILQREPIDVVVTDFHMPGMNGFELAQEIRVRWPEVGIIVLAGNVQNLLDRGAEWIDKIMSKESLDPRNLITAIVERGQATREHRVGCEEGHEV